MPGVFAVESDWSDVMNDRSSVRGIVELLAGVRGLQHLHKVAGSREILLRYLHQWSSHQMRGYETAYLAFHGSPGALWAGQDEVDFEDLKRVLAGRCEGRRLHLSGCSVGALDAEELQDLRRVTRAQVITAYATDVEWIEGAALDLVLLDWLADSTQTPGAIREAMSEQFVSLAEHLGLVIVTRRDVTVLAA